MDAHKYKYKYGKYKTKYHILRSKENMKAFAKNNDLEFIDGTFDGFILSKKNLNI